MSYTFQTLFVLEELQIELPLVLAVVIIAEGAIILLLEVNCQLVLLILRNWLINRSRR